ncbi:MAG: DUF190 domain-containing protein [Bacteroidales bacterium]|nr:DUF190 domain-containing protein [Bacteroidales bacterium]
MLKIILVLFGETPGTLGCYYLSAWPHKNMEILFPWGTLLVQALWGFIIGFAWGMVEHLNPSPNIRTFIFIGVLGVFTTFSTYALETLNLLRQGNFKLALINIPANNFAALLLVLAGFIISRRFVQIMKLPEKVQLLRIFIGEDDVYKGKLPYEVIVLKARELNLAGSKVLRGIMDFRLQAEFIPLKY